MFSFLDSGLLLGKFGIDFICYDMTVVVRVHISLSLLADAEGEQVYRLCLADGRRENVGI